MLARHSQEKQTLLLLGWDRLRLSNFVLDTTTATVTAGNSDFQADGVDPSTRQTVNNVYPLHGDVKTDNLHVFQGGIQTQDGSLSTGGFYPWSVSGTISKENSINSTGALKMTGSVGAIPENAPRTWNIIMLADSVFGG